MPVMLLPNKDGDVLEFVNQEALSTEWFSREHDVVFINGMNNSPQDHRDSALALSLMQMCRVVGVFNMSAGAFWDLTQCIMDKLQFHGPGAKTAREALDALVEQNRKNKGETDRVKLMESILARNGACLAMFRLLRNRRYASSPIFAHSQGNLILSNALCAVVATDGDNAVKGREVHSFGSPTVNWPAGLKHQEYGFTFDPVTWLAGFDTSFSISKVGVPSAAGWTLLSHSFLSYVQDDAVFVINRFRWGSLGITASLDEDGLATALAKMGTNLPRVLAVFKRLQEAHPYDVDDVAVLYVEKLNATACTRTILTAVKNHRELKQLLIDGMEKGWTSGREKAAINLLKT